MRSNPSANQTIIVGLGNPGRSYSRHRHNIGFAVVDRLAEQRQCPWTKNRVKAFVCETEIESKRVVLVKPQTYMNLSGTAVLPVLRRYKADPAHMIVIHDDMDLAAGKIRLKVGGGDGGHKGIRSIADSLRFRDFIRIRLGIGRPPEGIPPEEFVLSTFGPEEEVTANTLVRTGVSAVRLVLGAGVESAQNLIHSGRLEEALEG